MNETTRRYYRCRNEIPPFCESAIGITGPVVIRTKPPLWVRVLRRADAWLLKWAEFRCIYRQYRDAAHGRIYSARIAHGLAFRGLPF